jgi:hypothetical protein
MSNEGIQITSIPNSRSESPSAKGAKGEEIKPRKFQNGWSREQERLMAEWSDIASCYRWLHDKSEKIFNSKTLWINLPVIVLSTVGGTANFGIQSLFEDNELYKKYASFAIGGVSLLAGLLTTIGNYLRYAQYEESHRVASISWGKFQRLLAVELALNPNDRMDSFDFLKICRADLDRLIEQSPPIPKESISMFENRFGTIRDLKKPDICGALEHTTIFESSELRLKQMASDAALMLRRKKQTLNELVTPEMEKRIAAQVEERVEEAIEIRKKKLEDEIEQQRLENIRKQDEMNKALDERRKRLEEEIELEKTKIQREQTDASVYVPQRSTMPTGNKFENRLHYRGVSASASLKNASTRKVSMQPEVIMKEMDVQHTADVNKTMNSSNDDDDNNIVIVTKK